MQNYSLHLRFHVKIPHRDYLVENTGCVFIQIIHMSDPNHPHWSKKAAENQKKYKQFLHRIDKNTLLKRLPEAHETVTAQVDCLQCAACCRNYSPRFKTPDIKRIARHLGMKEGVFIETYLRLDEEGDYVVKESPCPFLGDDNFCSIYDQRPSDCARFPYTDEDVIWRRQALTLKNSSFCPIVYGVLEKLMQE